MWGVHLNEAAQSEVLVVWTNVNLLQLYWSNILSKCSEILQ